ncbi:HAD-IC family P-type ATPase, partial [Pseudomonas aeruginosa]|nr:HAD-IC family P-type ATPase [Pseudomonas aeruginosa]
VVALLVAIVPPLFFASAWLPWIYKGLTLLLIGCPCALVISTPAAITSGLAVAARRGALIKGGAALEQLGQVRQVAFDKTGTLTQDKIVLENHTDVSGKVCERVLHAAWLNSHYQTGLKNLLDTAVLEGVELDAARGLAERWQKVDEIPFDFERRRMSVV